ncbi:MAG: GTP pyrophosphokinase family protein [Clostridia bacterium]
MESILKSKKQSLKSNELISTKKSCDEFEIIMAIYKKALDSTMQKFINLKRMLNECYQYDVITNVTARIKSPESIAKKMQNKKIDINYENMIENINDIAGIRIICNYKDDIYKIKNIIRAQKDIKILKEKDYIKNTKKSGYSAYHMIVEVPVQIKEERIYIKVEIQIRTVLMDFWATTEHKVKYKPSKKISNIDSMKLCIYAKIINTISDKIMKIYRK